MNWQQHYCDFNYRVFSLTIQLKKMVHILKKLITNRYILNIFLVLNHELRTPREKIAFTARPKIQSQSHISRYGRSIFCLPHRPNFSDIFDLCLHWVSVVRVLNQWNYFLISALASKKSSNQKSYHIIMLNSP